jgi:hypothetical protein
MRHVRFFGMVEQWKQQKEDVKKSVTSVLESQKGIEGENVRRLEKIMAMYCGVKYAVGVASGTDALLLSLKALNVKRVLIPDFSFHASVGAAFLAGAEVELLGVDSDGLLDLSYATSANEFDCVMPVHLYGKMVDMEKFKQRYVQSKVIEDACQAIGARDVNGYGPGEIGDVACFSFYPTKNLGGLGDGGMCITKSEEVYERIKSLHLYGNMEMLGYNSRLDEIQAAILLVKLKKMDEWNNNRRQRAQWYWEFFGEVGGDIELPEYSSGHTFHQFVIRVEKRDELKKYLLDNGIETMIYYSTPLHKVKYILYNEKVSFNGRLKRTEELANKVLSLPICEGVSKGDIWYVVEKIKEFYGGAR